MDEWSASTVVDFGLECSVSMYLNGIIFSLLHHLAICGSIPPPPLSEQIAVRKCCPDHYYMTDQSDCVPEKIDNDTIPWRPTFPDLTGKEKPNPFYRILIGIPDCRWKEPWPVYQYHQHENPCERLVLLADGSLRHYVLEHRNVMNDSFVCEDQISEETQYQDYNISVYCMDKSVLEVNGHTVVREKAMLCVPENGIPWHDTNFVITRVINPVFHVLAIFCFFIVGVVYFVLPQLCDLTGNIITTLIVCLICEQISDIIRIYDEYHSAMSYLVSDSLTYVSSLGAFFWLNSFGFYVWKTFRSRNVFLRVTDGKKYCYYSVYAWGSTFSMASLALFAHLVLDTSTLRKEQKEITESAIGELGVAVFLTTIVFTILVDVFFCLSTLQVINRMSSYGRIHHKLKYSFQLFVKLFIIITANWFFFILSWFPIPNFKYVYYVTNLLQAVFILYVTVFNLKKVRFLLLKACCHEKCFLSCCRPDNPGEIPEWGEEMMAMNRGPY